MKQVIGGAGRAETDGAVGTWRVLARLRRRALHWWWGAPSATFHHASVEAVLAVVWREE